MKKKHLIITLLFSQIMLGQTIFNVPNGLWSTASNWSLGVPTASTTLAILTADVNLDSNHTIGGFLRSQTNTVSGTGILTSAGADSGALLSNGANFNFNGNLVINSPTTLKSLQVNNASGNGHRELTLGSSSVLTLTTPAIVYTQVDSKVVFKGKIVGVANLNFAGTSEFGATSDNTLFNGDMVFYANGSNVTVKTTGTGAFLKFYRKVQVNATNCALTIDGANACNGNLNVDSNNAFTLNINANQGSFGTVTPNGRLTINVASAVTNLSFSNCSAISWGNGTIAITGYQSGKIRFGTNSNALTSNQLSKIIADGPATGKVLSLNDSGYLVVFQTN
jgi:hypothetical protein